MYAADFDHARMIVFSDSPIPAAVRDEFRERYGATIREGVTLDRPGEESPSRPLLCVSRSDPDHYVALRGPHEVAGDVVPAGKAYGLIPSESGWRLFAETLRKLDDGARVEGREATGNFEDDEPAPAAGHAAGEH